MTPAPPPGHVHVLRIDTAGPGAGRAIAPSRALLSPAEAARADAFRAPRDRDRYALLRAALRRALGDCLGIDPAQVPLTLGPHDKPCLPGGSGLDFNLAHSGDLALIALSRAGPVGVDLELRRPVPRADRLAARIMSAHEHARYAALPPGEREPAFLRCWTRKEAYLKATGEGLSFALDKVSVSFAPGDPPRLLAVAGRPEAPSRWRLHDLSSAEAVCALATGHDAPDPRWILHDLAGCGPGGIR